MKENVIIVNCKVPSEAYQILSKLRQELDDDNYIITQAGIVKKEGGRLSVEDGFVDADATEGRSLTGGLIGSLVGVLAGPLGVLLGGSVGSLIGDSLDDDEVDSKTALLEKASECLVDGETALMMMVQEENEDALPAKLREFQVSITRMDAAEIASEVAYAEKKEAEKENKE